MIGFIEITREDAIREIKEELDNMTDTNLVELLDRIKPYCVKPEETKPEIKCGNYKYSEEYWYNILRYRDPL